MVHSRRTPIAGLVLGLASCSPPAPGTAAETHDSGSGDVGHGVTGAPETTGTSAVTGAIGAPVTTSSTGPADTTVDTTTLPQPDVGDHRDECSFALQDCPEGQKCIAVAATPETTWSEFRCVPVVEDPDAPGEPCTGMLFGADTCDRGSTCWHYNDDQVGHCLPNCWYDLPCEDSGSYCRLLSDNEYAPMLCFTTCDPLAQDCPNGEVCTYDEYWGPPTHNCYPATGVVGGALFADCAPFAHGLCAAGLACLYGATPPECSPSGCCLPYCDLDMPACPVGLQCLAFLPEGEQAPPGYEDVGVCQ